MRKKAAIRSKLLVAFYRRGYEISPHKRASFPESAQEARRAMMKILKLGKTSQDKRIETWQGSWN
jgi:hypothetical protein